MNKKEMYDGVVSMYKKTGQGLSSIFFRNNSLYMSLLNSLVDDGVLKEVEVHYKTMSNEIWYCLSNRYCVEEDSNPGALSFIRYYLGIDDLGLGIKRDEVSNKKGYMSEYNKWLSIHEEELKKSFGEEFEIEISDSILNKESIEFIKDREWYKENKSVNDCISSNREGINICNQMRTLINQLIRLQSSDENLNKLKEIDNEIKIRENIRDFLNTKESSEKIKSLF